jgi:hypothetical protein
MHGVPQQSTNGVAVQPVVPASGCLGGIAPPTYAGFRGDYFRLTVWGGIA